MTESVRDISTDKRPSSFFYMDVLRAYACLMIVVFHAHSISRTMPMANGELLGAPHMWFYSTIDLFFVMSGFLMVHMSRKLYGSTKGAKIFAAKRLARIPPIYWLYTIVIAILFLLGTGASHGADHVSVERLVASLFFWPVSGGPIIPLGWTLNYEVFFYVLFGLTVFLSFPRGPFVLVGLFAALVALGQAVDFEAYAPRFWCDPILLDFVWGILLAIIYHKGVTLPDPVRIALTVAAVVPILLVDTPFEYGDFSRPFTFGLSAALLTAAATLRRSEPTPGLTGRVLAEIGAYAYTLYLSHIIVLKAVELIYKKSGLADIGGPFPYIIVSTLIAVVAGYVAYLLIEKPLTIYLRKKIPIA